ncbi:MAG: hypothetical protein VCC67_14055 [Myxococcota bacterium]
MSGKRHLLGAIWLILIAGFAAASSHDEANDKLSSAVVESEVLLEGASPKAFLRLLTAHVEKSLQSRFIASKGDDSHEQIAVWLEERGLLYGTDQVVLDEKHGLFIAPEFGHPSELACLLGALGSMAAHVLAHQSLTAFEMEVPESAIGEDQSLTDSDAGEVSEGQAEMVFRGLRIRQRKRTQYSRTGSTSQNFGEAAVETLVSSVEASLEGESSRARYTSEFTETKLRDGVPGTRVERHRVNGKDVKAEDFSCVLIMKPPQ